MTQPSTRRAGGFTLTELMIVIAIIAIIAAIAIPSMSEAQKNANEASAITSLRQYLSAQGTYKRTDYDMDGVKEYAAELDVLYDWDGPGPAEPIKLIDGAMAKAEIVDGYTDANGRHQCARQGYYFRDMENARNGDPATAFTVDSSDQPPQGYIDGFGLAAVPKTYGSSGRKTFIIDAQGSVYEKVIVGLDFLTYAGSGDMPDGMPDIEAEGWALCTD